MPQNSLVCHLPWLANFNDNHLRLLYTIQKPVFVAWSEPTGNIELNSLHAPVPSERALFSTGAQLPLKFTRILQAYQALHQHRHSSIKSEVKFYCGRVEVDLKVTHPAHLPRPLRNPFASHSRSSRIFSTRSYSLLLLAIGSTAAIH